MYRIENCNPIPLLYQTGYLTIVDYDYSSDSYLLKIPNEEVRYGFFGNLMNEYVPSYGAGSGKDIFSIRNCLEEGDTDKLHQSLKALFASIVYTNTSEPFEHYFQAVVQILFLLLDQYTVVEYHVHTGRIDCVTETKKYIYIFEFKKDKSAEEALEQIEKNNYTSAFTASDKKIYKIGVNFNSSSRMIDDWKVITD